MWHTALDTKFRRVGSILPSSRMPPASHFYHEGQVKYTCFPRIRCHHCPGKLYWPGPGESADNFELHLRNSEHRERVEESVGNVWLNAFDTGKFEKLGTRNWATEKEDMWAKYHARHPLERLHLLWAGEGLFIKTKSHHGSAVQDQTHAIFG